MAIRCELVVRWLLIINTSSSSCAAFRVEERAKTGYGLMHKPCTYNFRVCIYFGITLQTSEVLIKNPFKINYSDSKKYLKSKYLIKLFETSKKKNEFQVKSN